MTSRVINNYSDPVNYFYKSSIGLDGKYEDLPGGHRRFKWNTYEVYNFWQRGNIQDINYPPDVGGVKNPYTCFGANDYNACLSKLVSKIKGHEFNLAVNVAQGKQVVNMIVDNLTLLGRSALAAKRGDFPSAIRFLKASPRGKKKFVTSDISGRWLELQYGWLPMIGDSFEAVKAFSETSVQRSSTVTASKLMKGMHNGCVYPPTNSTGIGPWRCRYKITYEMYEDISFPRTLGLVDPLSVVWEVLPWSFVVDWFLPIGSYLDNLAIVPFLKGRFMESLVYDYYNEWKPVDPGWANLPATRSQAYHFYYVRNVPQSLTLRPPAFQSFPSAMSPKRIYNAIALAHQRFR
jgi:hypothetical protein